MVDINRNVDIMYYKLWRIRTMENM